MHALRPKAEIATYQKPTETSKPEAAVATWTPAVPDFPVFLAVSAQSAALKGWGLVHNMQRTNPAIDFLRRAGARRSSLQSSFKAQRKTWRRQRGDSQANRKNTRRAIGPAVLTLRHATRDPGEKEGDGFGLGVAGVRVVRAEDPRTPFNIPRSLESSQRMGLVRLVSGKGEKGTFWSEHQKKNIFAWWCFPRKQQFGDLFCSCSVLLRFPLWKNDAPAPLHQI